MSSNEKFPIGVFDSGYGGLTILKSLVNHLPQYDFIYLGDNARAPYGTRSFEAVYHYTLDAVKSLFTMGCRLVVLACNTASAKALRTIQQNNLPTLDPTRRVLGVIRPTAELVGQMSHSRHVGIVGTVGTIVSESYPIEINKLFPDIHVVQQACPMWVPLIENEEINNKGSDYFIQKNIKQLLEKDSDLDTIILGCTHYPLILNQIRKFTPEHINLISQDTIVAESLSDYLNRHPEIEIQCSRNGSLQFLTTDSPYIFNSRGSLFFGENITAKQIELPHS